jgi:plasmid maintenance system antidote protein VapI
MDTLKSNIAKRLKLARNAMGITQEMFAAPLNMKQNNIKAMETTEEKAITPDIALRIEEAHGINASWLLLGRGDMFVSKESEAKSINAIANDRSIMGGTGNSLQITGGGSKDTVEVVNGNIVFEREKGPEKTRIVLPPTDKSYIFLKEQMKIGDFSDSDVDVTE